MSEQQQRARRLCVGDLMSRQYLAPAEIMGAWLTDSSLNLCYAPRGVGKTFFALQLAHAIATGSGFCGWTPERAKRVALFDGEMGLRSLQRRLWQIDRGASKSIGGDALTITSFETCPSSVMIDIANEAGQHEYERLSEGAEVIIIDNLLTCAQTRDKYDDDLSQWKRIQPWAIRQRQSGKTILFIHHAGKSGAQLGTSQRENVMDTIVALKEFFPHRKAENSCFQLHFEKHRNFYGEAAQPLYVEFITDPESHAVAWKWCTLDTAVRACVEEFHASGMRVAAVIAAQTGIEHWRVQAALTEMKQFTTGESEDGIW